MPYTEEQLKEVRDVILPHKAEAQRVLLKQLDKQTLHSLFAWAKEYQDKHPDFFRETFAVLAITDLYVMCDVVLGYNKANYGADMNRKLHGMMCARLDTRPRLRLGWLIAREHIKTQIVTIADSIRHIANDCNPRGVIASGIRDNAVKMLGAVKAQWESNGLLQWLYPYRMPDKKHTWNEDALVFSGRTTVFKEPCLEARGAESELTSAHWDWAKFDDLVGRENSHTDEQLAKTIQWWRLAQPLLSPSCEVDIVGTRYADNDLYGHQMDIKSPIQWVIIPATKVNIDGKEEPVWPEYHTMESLEQKRIDMGIYDYSCQMECDPVPKGEEEFKEHYFHLYDDAEVDVREVRHRVTPCDPAYTDKAKAASGNPDYSVVITGGWHPKHGLVVVDIDAGQVGTEKTVAWLHRHQSVWGSKVGVETQSALEDYIKLHNQQKPGKYIRWVKLKSGNHNKDSRIETLIPIAAHKPIWLPKKNPHSRTMIAQFLRFPRSKKRDLMDCLAYLPQMVRAVKAGKSGEDVKFETEYIPDSDITGY